MNYKFAHFLIAIGTVATMLPGTFLLNAKVVTPGETWQIWIYLIVTIICGVGSILDNIPIVWNMFFEQMTKMGVICTLFLFVSYCADEGDSFYSVDGFWEGFGVWLVAVLVLAVCFAFIGGAFWSLFSPAAWSWPANIVNKLAYGVGALFIGITFFAFVMDICTEAAVCSFIALTAVGGGKEMATSDNVETFEDEYGREIRGHTYGDRMIAESGEGVYRKRPDNGNWERI